MIRKNFSILVMIVLWIGMLIRTFFWWKKNSNNENILIEESNWFMEELTNTWDTIDTWNIEIDVENILDNNYTEIKVIMPKYFYNSWWKKFAEDLYKDKKVYIKFIFIDDLNSYKEQLYNENFSNADLFLFPYDRKEKTWTKSFVSEQNIQPYFDELLNFIVKDNQIFFLPFAADPMVMYTFSGYSSANTFYEISEFVLNWEPTRALSFPLFFGLTTEDADNKWFKREYQDIIRYAFMHYFKTNNDSHDLQIRIDSNVLQKYNIQNVKTISNIITTPACKYFSSICFQIYNFVWIRFWFLSDADIINQYFSDKKTEFSSIKKFPVPFYQLESPIRIRWRWISSSLKDPNIINWVYEFIKQYMNKHNQYNLRNTTLSVFKSDQPNWLLDNIYIWLRWYVLTSWWDYINTLRWINSFWELLWYNNNMTAKEYLK